jgi:hypothetical protein
MRLSGFISLVAIFAIGMLVLPSIVRAQMRDARESAGVGVVATATVKAIDPATRTITLEASDGDTRTIKCGEEVRNFDQVKVGDQVKAVAIERLCVSVGKAGSPSVGDGALIARAPRGNKPGIIIGRTEQVTAKVEAVDAANQTVTLSGVEGQSKPIKVSRDVDLSSIKAGDEVTLRLTRGVALWVQSPQDAAQPAAGVMGPQGGIAGAGLAGLEVATATATVDSVDRDKRTVTLKNESGQTRTIHLGKEAINFDQIQVGDKVRATLAEEIAISVSKGSAPPVAGDGALIARAPQGSKPGVLIADSAQVSGKIQSIDADKRTIALTDADGKSRTIKAGPNVNLSELSAGDTVTARVTQALAIVVEKP